MNILNYFKSMISCGKQQERQIELFDMPETNVRFSDREAVNDLFDRVTHQTLQTSEQRKNRGLLKQT